jgi:hypothetical protein
VAIKDFLSNDSTGPSKPEVSCRNRPTMRTPFSCTFVVRDTGISPAIAEVAPKHTSHVYHYRAAIELINLSRAVHLVC